MICFMFLKIFNSFFTGRIFDNDTTIIKYMKTVTTTLFENDVLNSDKPVLVDFGADWCQPCKALKPTLESFAQERTDVSFVFVDIDESDKLASQYQIMSVPTLAVFNNGQMLGRIVGNAPKAKIEELLNQYLS